ncbi:hypothetical protein MP638_000226 [Amoeboaphelidium occidentale]|nr:hypothetical protein MP638_000226 [Amoeboaphelidium occidentale]
MAEEKASLRPELVQQARNFLNDPKVADAPLAKKLAFLETKGLTQAEIEEALRPSSSSSTGTSGPPALPSQGYPQGVPVQYVAQGKYAFWKDIFIGLVGLSGLSVGVYQLCSHYYPEWFGLEKEEDALNKFIDEFHESQSKNEEHLMEIKKEIVELKDEMPKVDGTALQEIQMELKSVKALLLSRRQFPANPQPIPIVSSTPIATNSEKTVTLPEWQQKFVSPGTAETDEVQSLVQKEE